MVSVVEVGLLLSVRVRVQVRVFQVEVGIEVWVEFGVGIEVWVEFVQVVEVFQTEEVVGVGFGVRWFELLDSTYSINPVILNFFLP